MSEELMNYDVNEQITGQGKENTESSDDFFNALISSTSNEESTMFSNNEPSEQQQMTDEQKKLYAGRYKSVDDLESGYKHWQSEAYKRDNQIKEMQEELSALKEIKEAIATDDELAQRLMSKFQKGGNQQNDTQNNQFYANLKEPQKPQDFNEYEITDPSTTSGKWALEMQQFQQRKMIRDELMQVAETQKQTQLAEAKKQQMQNLYVNLAQQYGEQEARARIEFMTNPRNVTPEALLALYELVNNKQIPQSNIKRDMMNSMRPQYPASIGNGMSMRSGADTRSAEDKIWDSIMNFEKSGNPFG